jgi:hypothetical protein
MIPIVKEMIDAANQSVADLRERITDAKYAGFDPEMKFELISFKLDGEAYLGKLAGRNKDLCLDFGMDHDKAIAVRVFLDGDANKIN